MTYITREDPIEVLGLSTRAHNVLRRSGIHTVEKLLSCSREELLNMHNLGIKTVEEIALVIDTVRNGNGEFRLADAEELFKRENALSVSEERVPVHPAENTGASNTREELSQNLSEIEDLPLNMILFSARARNALRYANIQTVGALIGLTEKDILSQRNIGLQTKDEIVSVINMIMDEGKTFFEKLKNEKENVPELVEPRSEIKKGFDFAVIDYLIEKFGFKPVRMTEWFGLSRQAIYNVIEKRSRTRESKWTGKDFSEQEKELLGKLISYKCFDYEDDSIFCCCMNNQENDFVCLFIYENDIKCFFLKDLPEEVQNKIINANMHKYTEQELEGESAGEIVYILRKPYYRPFIPDRFRANAQLRGMTVEEYSMFISGYPYVDQRRTTDNRIIAFLQANMVDGKVYISSDPENQWIRSIASRNGYSIKGFIELYGFESGLNGTELTTEGAKIRHREELKKHVVHDNVVYFPTYSRVYRLIHTYAYKIGVDMNSYIRSLGFERTTERPDTIGDILEKDMRVRQSEGSFEDKVFAAYPLIGSRILKQETVDKLNINARKYIDHVLMNPQMKLPLSAEMQITLALINHAKNWKTEDNNNFWNYITLQFGYRDGSGSVVRILQSSLENTMKHNHRLFIEDENGRAFKTTVLIHALSTKRSWMLLFDFLFDFYKNNLNWRVIPNDPLIAVMVHALQQKLSGSDEEDTALTISSKVYSFQEGIRKLVLYRPAYTRELFETLIGKINSLVNSEMKPVNKYEELLCEEWFKEKITAIANSKKSERQYQTVQHDVAIDYSRIRVKYILKNETDVQIVLPDIRLKNEDVKKATLIISCNGTPVLQHKLSWYGNELGKTLNGTSVSIPFIPYESDRMNVRVQIACDEETIFDSDEEMNRNVLLFYGTNEITQSQIKCDRYTLIVPAKVRVGTENADVIEIDTLKNDGLKAYFLELKDGYVITVNDRLLAFDSENGTEIRVLAPKESSSLPFVAFRDTESYFAYRRSFCTIILGSSDYLQQFVLLKNGEKLEFSTLQQSDNGLAFTLPFDDEIDYVRLQVINLADERLVFDKSFVLINEADCYFNREFYFSKSDFIDAAYYVNIDDFQEVIPFTKGDSEIRIPFREGELHTTIPKVEVEETSGAWMLETQSVWFIGAIPQTSLLKVNAPTRVEISFLVGGKDIQYDGQGLVTIGNVLQSFSGTESFTDANVIMCVSGPTQKASYTLAKVFFKERFLKRPEFWFEDNKLFWDHGGSFIGNAGRQFSLSLTSPDKAEYEFKLVEDTDFLPIPDEMPIGNYRYQVSIQTGSLFKKIKETIASGDCIIGDKNLLRFMDRKIVVESITDEFNEEAGHILIRTCYIDQIKFCGVEDTSEGLCPVYNGILYTIGNHGERYEFSHDVHTNKKGITKMMVNPVRIVYISDSSLCITDTDGDGLYYYNYYDRNTESIIYALTDHEYTKVNKHKYSNADLYSYRTERI